MSPLDAKRDAMTLPDRMEGAGQTTVGFLKQSPFDAADEVHDLCLIKGGIPSVIKLVPAGFPVIGVGQEQLVFVPEKLVENGLVLECRIDAGIENAQGAIKPCYSCEIGVEHHQAGIESPFFSVIESDNVRRVPNRHGADFRRDVEEFMEIGKHEHVGIHPDNALVASDSEKIELEIDGALGWNDSVNSSLHQPAVPVARGGVLIEMAIADFAEDDAGVNASEQCAVLFRKGCDGRSAKQDDVSVFNVPQMLGHRGKPCCPQPYEIIGDDGYQGEWLHDVPLFEPRIFAASRPNASGLTT